MSHCNDSTSNSCPERDWGGEESKAGSSRAACLHALSVDLGEAQQTYKRHNDVIGYDDVVRKKVCSRDDDVVRDGSGNQR